ncbi:hypothetical protein MPTK1_8g16950 [Marchantia polymorpha subsp. ruderalis]|nr:hypothetical protein MARPO_0030s0024 [Marchantia polymorpha]PTQ42282.1 hypothetical protein MARPO_0030s0028 [Marchantia polymorpha]BBN20167.1 hypothetical protein Mp_8g16950 [Marchantia polymorpha subsp. ruderalis]|eukprot:PTQ42276.1 hypothetical protein MARPO_0030s0024 [Marchantia polymorpha]
MRREGRIHGSYVRESKHAAWPPVKPANKPTSHSKCTGKCGNGRVRCKCCAFALPVDKSLNKTKGFVKAKAYNITSNYKMQEWRVCDSSPPSSSSSKKPILKVERTFCAWDQNPDLDYQPSDSECEDESQQDDDVNDQDEEPNSWTSEIVVPIESLLRAPKSRLTVPNNVSEDVDESTSDSASDSGESWASIDFSMFTGNVHSTDNEHDTDSEHDTDCDGSFGDYWYMVNEVQSELE